MLYPKIGIRPVIDGRWGGVRESLEAQTMAMAENAAKLISENLKYPDGIVGKILFDPIKEGADRLCVLTAEATPRQDSRTSWGECNKADL